MSLGTRQLEAINAIITSATYREAAAKAGCSEGTLYRWFKMPAFRHALADARRRFHHETLTAMAQRKAATLVNAAD